MAQLQRQVMTVIKKYNLFGANDRVLMGISGGPDSVALLNLIFDLNRTSNIYSELFIAHLNHLLRGRPSEEDERFVRNLAKKFKLSVVVERKDIKKVALSRKLSLEESARKERYNFLENAAQKMGANVIAVGHNADDNAETILHRVIRGTGILGVSGMRPKRKISPFSTIDLVRPLLFSWRKDIVDYLKEMNLSYRIDSTNLEKDRLRSRIRVELIPLLEKNYNAGIKRSLIRLSEIVTQHNDFLKSQADFLFEQVLVNKKEPNDNACKEIVLDIPKLEKAPQVLQQIVIREALIKLGIPLKEFSYKNYEDILNLFKHKEKFVEKDVKSYLNVGVNNNELHLSNRKYHAGEKPILAAVELKIPGETKLNELLYRVKIEVKEIRNGFLEEFKRNKTIYGEVVDFDKISLPLVVRMRKKGDKFWPLGSRGRKKIKDFFIDNKVPIMERDTVPIVTMNDQPIWIVGFRIDDRVRITKETKKILIMSFAAAT